MTGRGGTSGGAVRATADGSGVQDRCRALVGAVGGGVYEFDADGRVVAADGAAAAQTGRERDALLGEHVSAFLDGDDADRVVRTVRALGGATAALDVTVRGADGTDRACRMRLSGVDGGEGAVAVVRARSDAPSGTRDDPDVAATGDTYGPELDWYERIVENLPVGVYRNTPGPEGEFLEGNQTLADIFDADSFADLRDHSVSDRYPDPEKRAAFSRRLETAGVVRDVELRQETLSGREIWVSVTAVRTEEDGEVYFDGVVQDITERKERERQLAKYETIVETVEDGIYVVDEDGYFTMVNEAYAEMLGYDREDLVGDHVSLVVDEETISQARELGERLREGEADSPVIETELQTASGGTVHSEATFALLPESDGAAHRVGVARDITERRRLESELEEVLGRVTDGFFALDEDWRFTHVNERAEEMVDYRGEGLVGENVWEVFERGADAGFRERYERAMETQEPAQFEQYYPAPLDAWFEVRAYPSESGLSVYFRDVTDRKERERELDQSRQRLRTLVENFPNGAVALVDEDLRYRIAGGTPVDAVAETGAALEGEHLRETVSEELADVIEPRYRAALAGEASEFVHEHGGRHSRFHVFPVRDDDGEVFAAMGMSQDITDRVERERALERALDLLNRTERIADVAGWEVDPETREPYWSDHLFDLVDVDFEEQPTLEEALSVYHTEEDRELIEAAVEEALETGEPFDLLARFSRPEGDVGWLRVQGDPEVADGELVSLRGAVQDVTEQRERERQLEASNERLEQFAYAASHDLQEPLRMVSSYLSLIERRYAEDLDEDGEEFLEFAVDGADRMREMIDALLEYSRVETRGDPFEPVDLEEVFADVRRDFRMRIEETGADVTVGSLPRVRGDGDQLRQVFGNLLDNAIEYSGEGPPRVEVTARRRGRTWEVAVRDEGIGVDPEHEEQVFEVFQRLHTQDEHAGTGIGLALCRRIVERHGGDIWVESEPGEGATFRFTLPAVEAADGGDRR